MKPQIDVYKNRPTRALISLGNLRSNLSVARSLVAPRVKIMGVVKANAYGHGLVKIAEMLASEGVDYLGVAYLEEAITLRLSGISLPILVMGAINTEQIADFILHDIDITSSSLDKSREISRIAAKMGKTAAIHLKIDTGLERIGVHWYSAEKFLNESYTLPNLKVAGVFSHFVDSTMNPDLSHQQMDRLEGIFEYLDKRGLPTGLRHMANSGGMVHYDRCHYDMVRPGRFLYGVSNAYLGELKPVMTLKSKVSFFKVVPKGAGVSYDHTYITPQQTRVVTLPIGYGDGYSRRFSNCGKVLIRGKACQVIGRVCMDQTIVDIGPEGTAYNGDDVLIFGEDDTGRIDLLEALKGTDLIPHEVLCGITARVPRIYSD